MTPEQAVAAGININPVPQNPLGGGYGPQAPGADGDFLSVTRAAKRLYVGGLPYAVSENELRQFFNATMVAAQGAARRPGDSVLGVYLNLQKRFAFVEFRDPIEASQACQLDGIMFRGESLKIGRAVNYNPALLPPQYQPQNAPKLNISRLGILSNQVANGPNKIWIGGLPNTLTDDQARELLETFGTLRAFHMPKDSSTQMSKGYAFCEYEDHSITEAAMKGLNGIKIGDRTLAVKRAGTDKPQGFNPLNALISAGQIGAGAGAVKSGGIQPTRVVCLLQMVTEDNLKDDTEYAEIVEDVREECGRYGQVRNLVIPRPTASNPNPPGKGKVYVEFGDKVMAQKAREALTGRTFDNRTVWATFFSEDKWQAKDFS